MKKIILIVFGLAVSATAQVQQGGSVYSPSATAPILGSTTIAMTTANCDVLSPGSNCTLSAPGAAAARPWYLNQNITGTCGTTPTITYPLGQHYIFSNSCGHAVTMGGSTGPTVSIPNGTQNFEVNSPDGVGYYAVGGSGGVTATLPLQANTTGGATNITLNPGQLSATTTNDTPFLLGNYDSRSADSLYNPSVSSLIPSVTNNPWISTFLGTGQPDGNGFPVGESTYGFGYQWGVFFSEGQRVLQSNELDCYGVGDCVLEEGQVHCSGGDGFDAGEGCHGLWEQYQDTGLFYGHCTVADNCSPYTADPTQPRQVVTITSLSGGIFVSSSGQGQLVRDIGQGRDIIDTSSGVMNTGSITGSVASSSTLPFPEILFTGTDFPTSTFVQVPASMTVPSEGSTPTSPGTVTVAISTSPSYSYMASSTSGITPTTGIACVADSSVDRYPYFEKVVYSIVDSTHITLYSVFYTHKANFVVSFGGLCGMDLEQTAATALGNMQVVPVMGAVSSTALYVATQYPFSPGVQGFAGFLNLTCPATSLSRGSGNTATVTFDSTCDVAQVFSHPSYLAGLSGVTFTSTLDSSFNATNATMTPAGAPNTFTYTSVGSGAASHPTLTGTNNATYLSGGYNLYYAAQVMGISPPGASYSENATLSLEPNFIPFAANMTLTQPELYNVGSTGEGQTHEFSAQTVRAPIGYEVTLAANSGTPAEVNNGIFMFNNQTPTSKYAGGGGASSSYPTPFLSTGVAGWDGILDMGVQGGLLFNQSPFCSATNYGACSQPVIAMGDSSADTLSFSYIPGTAYSDTWGINSSILYLNSVNTYLGGYANFHVPNYGGTPAQPHMVFDGFINSSLCTNGSGQVIACAGTATSNLSLVPGGSGTNLSAGFSSPSTGVVNCDSTVVGDHNCNLAVEALEVGSGGIFVGGPITVNGSTLYAQAFKEATAGGYLVPSAGTCAYCTPNGGTITGLSAVTSVTLNMYGGDNYATLIACTANTTNPAIGVGVTNTVNAPVFTFAAAYTGDFSYSCIGY